jgi:hypothetical protein
MTSLDSESPCALCSQPATVSVEPPRRTLARAQDPRDPSYSITVILPDVMLCAAHAFDVSRGDTHIGWCDDERCRVYGEIGDASPCGHRFNKLEPRKS